MKNKRQKKSVKNVQNKRAVQKKAALSDFTDKSRVIVEFEPPVFKTKEEERIFMEQTKPIQLLKLPKMPDNVKTIGDYIREYELIQKKESKLSRIQRIVVKNVIHFELRRGRLILKPNQ